ncbi:MAG: amidohydrolase family protein [Pyrinomonadaceae bacterium]|nr:amidohydrolase family protein [Pyrinomonadaceae bacterium]
MQKKAIDSHQHFWSLDLFQYDWMSPDNRILFQNYLPENFEPILANVEVEKIVAVQAHQSLEETRWLLKLSDKFDFIAGVVGWVDLLSKNVDEQLAEFSKHPKFKGVRHIVQDEPNDEWILQPQVMQSIDRLAEFGLTYDILIFPKHLKYIPKLIESCPKTSFVVDHLAKPPIASGESSEWKNDLKVVADFPQVYCKLSGLVTEANHQNWKSDDLKPYIETALELFGTDRLMFGSDYPVCRLAAEYKTVLETYSSFLDENDKNKVMRENAIKFYNLTI